MTDLDTLLFIFGALVGSLATWYLGEFDKRSLRRQVDDLKALQEEFSKTPSSHLEPNNPQ